MPEVFIHLEGFYWMPGLGTPEVVLELDLKDGFFNSSACRTIPSNAGLRTLCQSIDILVVVLETRSIQIDVVDASTMVHGPEGVTV